jgi:hypothetical protein
MHRFVFVFVFAFALAACGELKPAETDAGPEVDAGLVEDTEGGGCNMRCFEGDLLADWYPRVGAADDQVTCCECRRTLYATNPAERCIDDVAIGSWVDNAAEVCPDCRDAP